MSDAQPITEMIPPEPAHEGARAPRSGAVPDAVTAGGAVFPARPSRPMRLGVAGPVGTGKSSLIGMLCRELGSQVSLGVVTNDIYTDEDAQMLRAAGVLDVDRIRAVETGACPHTAIRDDVSANLVAVEDLAGDHPDVELVLVESGGDNLTATFSPALADAQIFVLDVAGGGDVVRKGGPGIARADLLVVNKTDLAPHVGVDAALMEEQGREARDDRPVIALSRTDAASVERLTTWVLDVLGAYRGGDHVAQDPGPMAPHVHAEDDHGHWHEDVQGAGHDHARGEGRADDERRVRGDGHTHAPGDPRHAQHTH